MVCVEPRFSAVWVCLERMVSCLSLLGTKFLCWHGLRRANRFCCLGLLRANGTLSGVCLEPNVFCWHGLLRAKNFAVWVCLKRMVSCPSLLETNVSVDMVCERSFVVWVAYIQWYPALGLLESKCFCWHGLRIGPGFLESGFA